MNAAGSQQVDAPSAATQSSTSAIPVHPLTHNPNASLTATRADDPAPAAGTSAIINGSVDAKQPQSGSKGLPRKSKKSGTAIDYMQEPRRSIRKRPEELGLARRDPYHDQKGRQRPRRTVPFAAPYERSGVVVDTPATLKDWVLPGPLRFGRLQWLYVVVAQSLIAACISGAINFGVAVALYRGKPSVDIWTFSRQTLAGDMGVTLIIQQIVSFIITSSLVHRDLDVGPIGPLRRPWPPLLHLPSTPSPNGHWLGVRMSADVKDGAPLAMGRSQGQSKLNGWWWWFVRAVVTGSERNDLLAAGISWRQRLERLIWTAAQGFFLCCLTFWWYWPIAIAIVAPIYQDRELAGTYIPMIVKLLYGAIMSLLTNPIMALMALGAESSVRRCYPELEIWIPFGGQQDFAQWKLDHGVVDANPAAPLASSKPVDLEKQHQPV